MDPATTTIEKDLTTSSIKPNFHNVTQGSLSCKDFFDSLTERFSKLQVEGSRARSTESESYKHTVLDGLRPEIRENMVQVDSDGHKTSLLKLSAADLRCRAIQAELRLAAGVPPPGQYRYTPPSPSPRPPFQQSFDTPQRLPARRASISRPTPPSEFRNDYSGRGKAVITAWSIATGCCRTCKRPYEPIAPHKQGRCMFVKFSPEHWSSLCEEYEATGTIQAKPSGRTLATGMAEGVGAGALRLPTVLRSEPGPGAGQMNLGNRRSVDQNEEQNQDVTAAVSSKPSFGKPTPKLNENSNPISNTPAPSPTSKKKQFTSKKNKKTSFNRSGGEPPFPPHPPRTPSRFEMEGQESWRYSKKNRKNRIQDVASPPEKYSSAPDATPQAENEGPTAASWW